MMWSLESIVFLDGYDGNHGSHSPMNIGGSGLRVIGITKTYHTPKTLEDV